jgi:uncharacterized cupredoxin-like copper-binding protein
VRLTALALALAVSACAPAAAREQGGRTVVIDINHSHFSLPATEANAGETVRFVIRNHDPIDHEFILGDDAVHLRHAEGTEREHHGDVAGEVSAPPRSEVATSSTFGAPGELLFACHLPGHFQYGMAGTVTIR